MLNLKKTILFPKNNEAYSIFKLFQSYYIFFTVNNIVYCKKIYSMIGNQLLRTFLHFECVKFQLTFSVSVCLFQEFYFIDFERLCS